MTSPGNDAVAMDGQLSRDGAERFTQSEAQGVSPGQLAAFERRLPYSAMDFRTEIGRVKRARRIRAVLATVFVVVAVLAILAVFVFNVPASLRVVNTNALNPSLSEGQVVYIQKTDTPVSGDIVVYRDNGGFERFARVLAVAGEWVNVSSDGSVVIASVSLQGSTSPEVVKEGCSIVMSLQVPERSCVMDADSSDGGDALLANLENPVPYSSLVGQVTHRIWPLG